MYGRKIDKADATFWNAWLRGEKCKGHRNCTKLKENRGREREKERKKEERK